MPLLPRVAVIGFGIALITGCAIESNRNFSGGTNAELQPESGLLQSIHVYPGGFLTSETIDVPLILHVGYQRPPFRIALHLQDARLEYKRFEIIAVTLQYDGEEPKTIPQEESLLTFQKGKYADYPEIRQNIGELDRHEPATVTVIGTAVRSDGTTVNLKLSVKFTPSSDDRMSDWFSWVASC